MKLTHKFSALSAALASAALIATPLQAADPSPRDIDEGNLLYNDDGKGRTLDQLRDDITQYNDVTYIYTAMEVKQPAKDLYLCKRLDKKLTLTFGQKATAEIEVPVMTMEIFEDRYKAFKRGLISLSECTPLRDDAFARHLREEVREFNDESFATAKRDQDTKLKQMPKKYHGNYKVRASFL